MHYVGIKLSKSAKYLVSEAAKETPMSSVERAREDHFTETTPDTVIPLDSPVETTVVDLRGFIRVKGSNIDLPASLQFIQDIGEILNPMREDKRDNSLVFF